VIAQLIDLSTYCVISAITGDIKKTFVSGAVAFMYCAVFGLDHSV